MRVPGSKEPRDSRGDGLGAEGDAQMVLPTPGGPSTRTLSPCSMKWQVASCKTCFLSIEGCRRNRRSPAV